MYRLCYAAREFREGKQIEVYFTDNFEEVTGDDWDDAPYEHNAEPPYSGESKIRKLIVPNTYEIRLPCDDYINSPWSVDDINNGDIPWISIEKDRLYGGDSMAKFKTVMKKNKIKVEEEDLNDSSN